MRNINFFAHKKKDILKIAILFFLMYLIISAFTLSSGSADRIDPTGCRIRISARNGSATDTIILTDLGIKVSGGWWASNLFGPPPPITPGDDIGGTAATLFGCNVKRRFRFKLKRGNVSLPGYCYFPSENEWTTGEEADFGDVNRHFR